MNNLTLLSALERLTAVIYNFTDTDLNQPYAWRAHGEGVRFALLGTHFELEELAVQLAALRQAPLRQAQGAPPLTRAQRILGQLHTAYRDLQGVLAGFGVADYDIKPTPNDWPMRTVLAHMARVQMTFVALADYGRRMGQDSSLPEAFPDGEVERVLGSLDPFRNVVDSQGLPEMMAFFDNLHRQTLERFMDLSDDEVVVNGPVWWEGEGYPVYYRLGRMEAHLRQHTIQVVKTRTAVSGPINESVQLLRLLYNALAGVEAAVFGAPELGQQEMASLAEAILERADAVETVVRQVGELVTAARKGDTAVVSQILSANSNLANATDENGLPLIMAAVYYGQKETAELLREAGADIHIFEAAALGDLATVQYEGTEWPEDINEFSRDGFTPLQLACFFGHEAVAAWLVEHDADVMAVARNAQLIQPIHAAVARGNRAITHLLLEKGIDVNARQQGGFTPIHAAAQNGDEVLVNLLLEHGADPNLENDEGKNAADFAREAGHDSVVGLLNGRL